MTNLPKSLRTRLQETFLPFGRLDLVVVQGAKDTTQKFLYA